MSNFRKILNPFSSVETGQVFACVDFRDGRLSITGVEGPKKNGNARGACGQIVMGYRELGLPLGAVFAEGWDRESALHFFTMWDRWHLNDMRAGSAAQEDYLREHPINAVYPESHYELACKALAQAGLNPDASGYSYGHAWMKEEVPQRVVAYFQGLPESTIVPAWV